mmetsp:Transcript_10492/g.30671  ORF Transcript_10492/g.30671 Transcript_10492/m.30671 type:complete len:288 (+) Transcript_10492:2441-3304(+)
MGRLSHKVENDFERQRQRHVSSNLWVVLVLVSVVLFFVLDLVVLGLVVSVSKDTRSGSIDHCPDGCLEVRLVVTVGRNQAQVPGGSRNLVVAAIVAVLFPFQRVRRIVGIGIVLDVGDGRGEVPGRQAGSRGGDQSDVYVRRNVLESPAKGVPHRDPVISRSIRPAAGGAAHGSVHDDPPDGGTRHGRELPCLHGIVLLLLRCLAVASLALLAAAISGRDFLGDLADPDGNPEFDAVRCRHRFLVLVFVFIVLVVVFIVLVVVFTVFLAFVLVFGQLKRNFVVHVGI